MQNPRIALNKLLILGNYKLSLTLSPPSYVCLNFSSAACFSDLNFRLQGHSSFPSRLHFLPSFGEYSQDASANSVLR